MSTPLDTRGDRRRFAVLLTVLAVVFSVFVGKTMFGGGGGARKTTTVAEERVATGVASRADATTKPAAKQPTRSTAGPAAEDLAPTDSFEVFETRDPFQPPIDVTPTTPSTPTSPTTAGTAQTTTGTGVAKPPPSDATPSTTAAPSFDPGVGQSVAVLDVFIDTSGTQQARVRVGSTVYTVGVGDTFATSYKVVSLNEPCGQFLFGDSPFQLCEGEETIK
jgi:hypothetical protein